MLVCNVYMCAYTGVQCTCGKYKYLRYLSSCYEVMLGKVWAIMITYKGISDNDQVSPVRPTLATAHAVQPKVRLRCRLHAIYKQL